MADRDGTERPCARIACFRVSRVAASTAIPAVCGFFPNIREESPISLEAIPSGHPAASRVSGVSAAYSGSVRSLTIQVVACVRVDDVLRGDQQRCWRRTSSSVRSIFHTRLPAAVRFRVALRQNTWRRAAGTQRACGRLARWPRVRVRAIAWEVRRGELRDTRGAQRALLPELRYADRASCRLGKGTRRAREPFLPLLCRGPHIHRRRSSARSPRGCS